MKRFRRYLPLVLAGLFAWLAFVSWRIIAAAYIRPLTGKADVALVLGASAPGGKPSPVFIGRIDYAIALFESGQVGLILFTGGRAEGEIISDAEAAKAYAVTKGIPAEHIWIETNSHTTRQNVAEAKRLLQTNSSATCLLVSDPLHLFRASQMMHEAGLLLMPAPTPFTRIHSLRAKFVFFCRELWLYHVYLLTGQ